MSAKPPMALGAEVAGAVLAAGQAVSDWAPGDVVMTHPVPLRDQRTWAPRLIAPAGLLARKPPSISWEVCNDICRPRGVTTLSWLSTNRARAAAQRTKRSEKSQILRKFPYRPLPSY